MTWIKTRAFLAASSLIVPPIQVYAAAEGGHWWDAFSWLGDIANFIKYLIVPPENYFHNRLALLNNMVNEKFGGLGQLYQTLNDFFIKLSDPAPASLAFTMPNNFLWSGSSGFRVDVFQCAAPYISLLRGFLTAAFFLLTVIVCYHKIRTFFTEEG